MKFFTNATTAFTQKQNKEAVKANRMQLIIDAARAAFPDLEAGQLPRFIEKLEGEAADLEAKISKVNPSLLAGLPEYDGTKNPTVSYCGYLMDRMKVMGTLERAMGSAPATAASPSLPPEVQNKQSSTAEQIGKSVVALATSSNPEIRRPIINGLQQSLEVQRRSVIEGQATVIPAEKLKDKVPNFDWLPEGQAVAMRRDYEHRGGLRPKLMADFRKSRREYLERTGHFPEVVYECPLPVLMLETKAENKERMERLQRIDANFQRSMTELEDVIKTAPSRPGLSDADRLKLVADTEDRITRLKRSWDQARAPYLAPKYAEADLLKSK